MSTTTTTTPSNGNNVNELVIKAEDFLSKYKLINQLHAQTNIARVPLCLGLLLVSLLLIQFIFGADALCNLVGFLYPARETLNALRSSNNIEDYKFWCHYWLVFSLVVTFEAIFDPILSSFVSYFPLVKLAFFVFCFMPQTRGASLVYVNVIDPAYLALQGVFDEPVATKQA